MAGRLPGAEIVLKKSLTLNPGRQEAHKWLGEVYARQGKRNAAIESYQKYLEGSPKDAEAIRNKIDKLTKS
jgi:regulator of sirC expression with transglutaminase-like and TPR domain